MTGMTTEAHSPQQPVLVIMGVSGSGKSTVAGILAGQLGWDLEEGDDLHPAASCVSWVPFSSACVSKPPKLTVYTVVGTPAFTHRATRSNCCSRLDRTYVGAWGP